MRQKLLIFMLLFVLAVIGHSYIIYRFWVDGILFTGPNDGMEQMIPIQMFLYDNWSQGNWFYATDFGLGGDFFTDLAYYFSTNILFIINVIIISICKLFIHMPTSDVMFWMTNAIVLSIAKAFLAMCATFYYAHYILRNRQVAILVAALFVLSPLYFRFTVYWPFFSDIFILLPLLLLAIERFLQHKKIGLFIIVVAISLINNFYFAYYQCLTGIIYLALRLIFRHKNDIKLSIKHFSVLFIAALLGLGCSLFFFFHGVMSFVNNRRIPFNGEVPLFEPLDKNTNLFYDNYLIVVIFITIQALLAFKLYKHFYFKLFALCTLFCIIAAFIPYIDQVFNGFSAPQKRWHYLLAFSSAMLIGSYVKYFKTLSIRHYCTTSVIAIGVIITSAWLVDTVVSWVYFVPIVCVIGLLILLLQQPKYKVKLTPLYSLSIIILLLLVSFVFIKYQIYFADHQQRANKNYVQSSMYNSQQQRELVNKMQTTKNDDERIDWRVDEQDNTPMYQHFKGLSLYSSIFHHNILDFYYDHLKINMVNESVSRYQSTNGRQNLASLLSVKYLMRKEHQSNVPSYFKKVEHQGQYEIYKNQLPLPAVRVSNKIYDARKLHTPIAREHAMLTGIVLPHKGVALQQKSKNLLNDVTITTDNIQQQRKNKIKVTKNSGQIKLHIPQKIRKQYDDFYLTMKIKRGLPDSNFSVQLNQYQNNRLFNNSTYKTGVYTQLYRTQPDSDGNISIDISPYGTYQFQLLQLHGENYDTLKQATKQQQSHHYHDINNGVKVDLGKHESGMAQINIPYRQGMTAFVDGKKVTPQKVNYFMTGVPVRSNNDTIIIKYKPPFWFTMIIISLVSIVISVIFRFMLYKKSTIHKKKRG